MDRHPSSAPRRFLLFGAEDVTKPRDLLITSGHILDRTCRSTLILTELPFMIFLVALLGLFLVSIPPASAQGLSDDAVRHLLIEQSIAGYGGNCPCPYNSKRNGHRCGGSSAYSRPVPLVLSFRRVRSRHSGIPGEEYRFPRLGGG